MILIIMTALHGAFADEPLTKSVGVLTGTTITSRDVRISAFLEEIFQKRPFSPVIESSKNFPQLVRETLLEQMIYLEAGAIKAEDATPEDYRELEKDLLGQLSSAQAKRYWESLDVSQLEQKKFFEIKLRSKKLLQFRTLAVTADVTDQKILSFYQKNKSKFGSASFEKLKPTIKTYLEQESAQLRLKDWLSVLQKKYRVKSLVGVDS